MEQKNNTPLIIGIVIAVVLLLGVGAYALINNANQDATNDETTETTQTEEVTTPEPTQNIVEIASENPDFSTLVTALEAADLVDTLSGEGPFTVFAPTNAAFDALPEGTLDSLLADPEALANVLTYHVVAGNVPAVDVVTLDSATTLQGQNVSISVVDGIVTLNGNASVVQTDNFGTNGIIHVIDAVLLPQ